MMVLGLDTSKIMHQHHKQTQAVEMQDQFVGMVYVNLVKPKVIVRKIVEWNHPLDVIVL